MNLRFKLKLGLILFVGLIVNNVFSKNVKYDLPDLVKKIERIEERVLNKKLENNKNKDNKKLDKNDLEKNIKVVGDQTCVVVLMVKNEAESVIKTLSPFVDAGINNIFLFDTGSTDGTQDIVRKYFKEKNVNGILMEEPFVDFATSRNRALRLAEQNFVDASFMIMPDAEWYFNDPKKLVEYLKNLVMYDYKGYYIRLLAEGIDFYIPRIFKCGTNANFKGVVHEVLDADIVPKLPEDVYFSVAPTRNGIEKSRKRWTRDSILLKQEHEKNPKDARTCYYLAQTYACLGDYENAIKYFKVRENLEGWSEENYMARYMLGYSYSMAKDYLNSIDAYLKAYEFRPIRAESLVRIAQNYIALGQKNTAYIYALRACEIEYPKDDILFVEKDTYDALRYEILLECALNLNQVNIARWAVVEFLKHNPDDINMKKNLEILNEKIKSTK